ncbi:hypothetical protein E7W39_03750 [Cronobacter sakazakii]|uniref:hypothetical protein n=1 Tax=Enterobacteriaceae TaxID=543 RepID=UPI000495A894|nr:MULTISPECIES: hypothetical protein [Enterobacteriaceae]EGT4277854.1 hypothetical protein [Cronobacter sakazakii]EGT5666981.1 hypothetical protein [Cronobacter sakazakii]EGZ7002246.1 hypothetical protein [Cronobacter sakazakii]EGZ7011507.1 hypothetical protein [Cronobacter sakazakii]EGZ7015764.1 hypothetical protein [Cronobacter sakazakii]
MSQAPLENMALAAGYNMQHIFAVAPQLMEQLVRNSPLTYNDFVEQIDKDLNNIIIVTESGRQHHMDKGEDALTDHIISQLKQLYPSVHHDAQNGGHCDYYFEVRSAHGELYQWVAEAKLWEGPEYVYQGLDTQLLGSYAKGGVNSCRGGLIFYSKLASGAKYAMDEWHKKLGEKGIQAQNRRSDGLRFDTIHKLNGGTGADFYVRHYCVDLYHAPTQLKLDKAASKKQ